MTNERRLKALTVRQPWAWAIMERHKRVENRSWCPPDWALSEFIAIHAAKGRPNAESMEWLEGQVKGAKPALVFGAILGLVRIRESITDVRVGRKRYGEWFGGPVGWALSDVFALPEALPCKGQLGLWNVPPALAGRIWGWADAGTKAPRDRRRAV